MNIKVFVRIILLCVFLFNSVVYAEDKQPRLKVIYQNSTPKNIASSSLADDVKSAVKEHRKKDTSYQYYTSALSFARADKKFAKLWLESKGFFSAKIKSTISKDQLIELSINPGQPYTIRKLNIQANKAIKVPTEKLESLKQGDFLIASHVLAAKSEIAKYVVDNNCLFNVKVDYQALVATEEQQADINFNIMDSPQVRYGDITWEGLSTVKDSVIEKQLLLKKDRCFKRTELDQQRIEFLKTNLIVNVRQKLMIDESTGLVNIHYQFSEAEHKTIKTGVAMVTDEGVELSGSWENRNIFGSGERLTVDVAISPKSKKLESELEFPEFYSEKNNLLLSVDVEDQELEAYDTKGISLGANLRRIITKRSYGQLGIKYKHTELSRQKSVEKFDILSFPISYIIDTTKNPLDPRSGAKAKWTLEHFVTTSGDSPNFTKFDFSIAGYKTAEQLLWQPTLAAKISSGLITSISASDILPANELYYVGGGGSVRGYPYQTLGPLYNNKKPAGGLSFAEVSLEGRFHINKDWGFAVFTEGGSAFADNSPEFDSRWKWAAGLGLRYYTGFAPMRVDLAFPLSTKRQGIDDSFQLYISMGEAF